MFSDHSMLSHEKFHLLLVLAFYSGSFLLTSIYYAYCASQGQTDYLEPPALADVVMTLRYILCECLPLGLVMVQQYKNHKLLIREWKEEQRLESERPLSRESSSTP
jgi:hypothetical protein